MREINVYRNISDQALLTKYLKSIHKNNKEDFRWKNLRSYIIDHLAYIFKHDTKKSILDIGCGTGHMTIELLRHGYNITSGDSSKELVEFTRDIVNDNEYHANVGILNVLNLESLGDQFDAVICLDVIEHVEDDEFALKNINSVLKKGGFLICSVPAIKSLYGIRDKELGHFRRYNKKELIKKIESTGFILEKVIYWNFIGFFPFIFSEKILNKKVYTEMRYSKSWHLKFINKTLNFWFHNIENKIRLPFGLTLIMIVKKL